VRALHACPSSTVRTGEHNHLLLALDASNEGYLDVVIADDLLAEANLVVPKSSGAKCQVLGCTSDLRKEEKSAYCTKVGRCLLTAYMRLSV